MEVTSLPLCLQGYLLSPPRLSLGGEKTTNINVARCQAEPASASGLRNDDAKQGQIAGEEELKRRHSEDPREAGERQLRRVRRKESEGERKKMIHLK